MIIRSARRIGVLLCACLGGCASFDPLLLGRLSHDSWAHERLESEAAQLRALPGCADVYTPIGRETYRVVNCGDVRYETCSATEQGAVHCERVTAPAESETLAPIAIVGRPPIDIAPDVSGTPVVDRPRGDPF